MKGGITFKTPAQYVPWSGSSPSIGRSVPLTSDDCVRRLGVGVSVHSAIMRLLRFRTLALEPDQIPGWGSRTVLSGHKKPDPKRVRLQFVGSGADYRLPEGNG